VTLQRAITELLSDSHCQAIDFHIAGLHVDGAGLSAVARCIQSGHIALCPRDDLSTPGRYRFSRDELHVQSEVADDLDDDVNNRALIVHEAVHALTDMRRVAMSDLQSESVGFITQALYKLLARNGRRWRSRVTIHTAALDLVVAKRLNARRGVRVQFDDYSSVRRAISEHPHYRGISTQRSTTGLGIARRRGARCHI
jgi:hypothetical protein